MTPEERLDRLLELREQGAPRLPMTSEDLAARIAAADALAHLQAIDAPPEIDARLEARIRARARQLAHQHGGELPVPRPPQRRHTRLFSLRRGWGMALGMAAALLLLLVGTLSAAASSLPGDPLYSLKQFEHEVRLSFASDQQDRAELEISQLQSGLADLNTVIGQKRGDAAIQQALETVVAQTRDSQAAVAAVPAGAEQTAVQRDLVSALTEEEQALHSGLARVDWPLRLAFTQQLGALGEAIPTLTKVSAEPLSNNTITITLTGTNFAQGAQLTINGVAKGSVSKNTPTTLVVTLNASDWPKGPTAVGVLNPDGTAAQITLKAGSDDNDHDSDDQPQSGGTPGATGTPGGDDRGDDDGAGRTTSPIPSPTYPTKDVPTPTQTSRPVDTPTSPPDH